VRTIEKSVSLNMIKTILKVGIIWITCSRSLEFGLVWSSNWRTWFGGHRL